VTAVFSITAIHVHSGAVGMTREEFLTRYVVMDGAADTKADMLDALGITQKEMKEALQRAHSESAECQSLRKLVRACRRANWSSKTTTGRPEV